MPMNDPHVKAIHFYIQHDDSVDYSDVEPLVHDDALFCIRAEKRKVVLEPKCHYATEEEARSAAEEVVRRWEFEAALRTQSGAFRLMYERVHIVDRDPPPGVVKPDPVYWNFRTSVPRVTVSRRPPKVLRLTAENPLDAVIARLQQFTSTTLARKLVERRAKAESKSLTPEEICSKAIGIAFAMRGALDYIVSTPRDALNKRVLGLYYGAMALAQAEMLASPSGPTDLDQVEGMTLRGHGLYVLPDPPCTPCGFAGIRVGVLASGFFPEWLKVLGHDTSGYPKKKLKPKDSLKEGQTNMACSLRDLFASMPEIADLFGEVFGGTPNWVSVVNDLQANRATSSLDAKAEKVGSTYAQFIDHSGKVSVEMLKNAGWPLTEIGRVEDPEDTGTAFRGRVDHAGKDVWWTALPTFTSPFVNSIALLLFPTVGGICHYRTIAVVTLYVLSIMVRYMPSKWRRIEGGDEDQYLALVRASLAVWERLLPQHFLESIAGETVRTAQPGSLLA